MKNKNVFGTDSGYAQQADRDDPLSMFRDEFILDDSRLIYLDGNSLGRLPKKTRNIVDTVVNEQWGNQLIRSWNSDWIGINERIGAKIARLIGAKPNEVLLTDSTSLNLFKLAFGSMKFHGEGRPLIISDDMNFPSDLYILQGLLDVVESGYKIKLAHSNDGISILTDNIVSLINNKTALLCLSHVSFKSAFRYDMESITRSAHAEGAHVLWDLSHSVGAVPISLNACHADMAVGCTYKYLNGGPGSTAFLFVREDLQDKIANPIWGWFAHENPFNFDLSFKPLPGINRFLTSTTSILSAAATEPGIDLLLEARMDRISDKSALQTEYLIYLFDSWLAPLGFELGTPRNPESRGSHISIRHPEAYRITQAMMNPIGNKDIVIPDFRAPDFIRLGIAPLYTSFTDIYRGMLRIKNIVDNQEYKQMPVERT